MRFLQLVLIHLLILSSLFYATSVVAAPSLKEVKKDNKRIVRLLENDSLSLVFDIESGSTGIELQLRPLVADALAFAGHSLTDENGKSELRVGVRIHKVGGRIYAPMGAADAIELDNYSVKVFLSSRRGEKSYDSRISREQIFIPAEVIDMRLFEPSTGYLNAIEMLVEEFVCYAVLDAILVDQSVERWSKLALLGERKARCMMLHHDIELLAGVSKYLSSTPGVESKTKRTAKEILGCYSDYRKAAAAKSNHILDLEDEFSDCIETLFIPNAQPWVHVGFFNRSHRFEFRPDRLESDTKSDNGSPTQLAKLRELNSEDRAAHLTGWVEGFENTLEVINNLENYTRTEFRAEVEFSMFSKVGIVGIRSDGPGITYLIGNNPFLKDSVRRKRENEREAQSTEKRALSGETATFESNGVPFCEVTFTGEFLSSNSCVENQDWLTPFMYFPESGIARIKK